MPGEKGENISFEQERNTENGIKAGYIVQRDGILLELNKI